MVWCIKKSSARNGKLPAYVFEVTRIDDIYNVIIPFFKSNPLQGIKAKSFQAFCKIAELVNGRFDTKKLTSKEIQLITEIKQGMNKHYGSLSAGKPHA